MPKPNLPHSSFHVDCPHFLAIPVPAFLYASLIHWRPANYFIGASAALICMHSSCLAYQIAGTQQQCRGVSSSWALGGAGGGVLGGAAARQAAAAAAAPLPHSPSSSLSQSGLAGDPAATYRALSSSSRPVLQQQGREGNGSSGWASGQQGRTERAGGLLRAPAMHAALGCQHLPVQRCNARASPQAACCCARWLTASERSPAAQHTA